MYVAISGPCTDTVDGSCLSEATSAHFSHTFSALDNVDDWLPEATASFAVHIISADGKLGIASSSYGLTNLNYG